MNFPINFGPNEYIYAGLKTASIPQGRFEGVDLFGLKTSIEVVSLNCTEISRVGSFSSFEVPTSADLLEADYCQINRLQDTSGNNIDNDGKWSSESELSDTR